MIDAITYVADVNLLTECSMFVRNEETGELVFQGAKIPTHRSGDESVSMVRVSSLDMLAECGLVVLASAPMGGLAAYEALSGDALATYNRVYDQSPVTYTDEDGVEQTYTPSPYLGVFA